MWYDKLKKETIYINREEDHSKYWSIGFDETTHVVITKNGRLGTKGLVHTKNFDSNSACARFIETKTREKTNKGYKKITQTEFEKLSIEASIVGTQNKCDQLQWVEYSISNGLISFESVGEDRLSDPACNPGLRIELTTRKEYNGKNHFEIIFTVDAAYELQKPHGSSHNTNVKTTTITKSHYLYELVDKAEAAIGHSLA